MRLDLSADAANFPFVVCLSPLMPGSNGQESFGSSPLNLIHQDADANYFWSCGGLLCWPEGGLLWRFSGELVCSLAWSQVGIRTNELSR
jgi:hypothetical protein